MSAASIAFLNFGIHSLVLAALGWLIVRFVIRDALRRSHAAFLAVLFSLIGAFDIGFWPFPYDVDEAPVWTAVHQTLESNWRVAVAPAAPESAPSSAVQSAAPTLDVNQIIRAARWLYWGVTGLLLLRLLIHSGRVQFWAWRLRGLTQDEIAELPEGGPLTRLRVVEGDATPCAAGWLPPVIALPSSAFGTLSPHQWRWLLRHEAEHLRRADTVAALIQGLIRALLWWNPFVHALIEHHSRAIEEVCDAAALEGDRDASAYSDFLLDWAAKPALQPACVMPIAASTPARRLKARLVALMEARGVRKRIGALFVLACVIGVIALPMLVASLGITTAGAQGPAVVAEKPDDGKLYTRVFKITPEVAVQARQAKDWLSQRGVVFTEGATAVTNRVTSQLIVRNTRTQFDKVEAVLAEASMILPQVYSTSRIIIASQFYGNNHGAVLSPRQFQELMSSVENALQSAPGMELRSAPAMTMKLGTEATVEAIREGPPAEPGKFAGTKIELKVRPLDGGRVEASIKPSFGTDHGESLLSLEGKAEVDWSRVTILSSEARASMVSGETLVAHVTVGARCITTLTTLTALRPGGQTAAGGFAEKISGVAEAAKSGDEADPALEHKRAYLTVKIVEVNVSKGSLVGDIIALPAWPVSNPAAASEPASQPKGTALPPSAAYALAGVLTDPQFQVVIRALGQKKGVDMSVFPGISLKSGQTEKIDIPNAHDGGSMILTPQISGDTSRLDLGVRFASPEGAVLKRNMSIAVIIWFGHTIVLSAPVGGDDQNQRTRLIFITAQMIDVQGVPKEKAGSK